MKRPILAWLAIFLAWCVLDFLGHGLGFASLYASTPDVWRPQSEMNVGLIWLAVAITAAGFVTLYSRLVNPKSTRRAMEFGFLFGLANAVSTSFGGYAVHPIPGALAVGWFVLITFESVVAGLIAGAMLREPPAPDGG